GIEIADLVEQVEALRAAGVEVIGMVAIFTYGFKLANDNFDEYGVQLKTLSNYKFLIDEAVNQNYVAESVLESLKKWRQNPAKWEG
ncbi:MAG: orotate phosphoribosyltransferase, partial [Spirosomaceae bacterium]|nr:orotate phosphoribosyltransferase [Spirosomataceae bacterium]